MYDRAIDTNYLWILCNDVINLFAILLLLDIKGNWILSRMLLRYSSLKKSLKVYASKKKLQTKWFQFHFYPFKNILLLFYFISMKHLGIFIFKWRKLLVRANSFNSLFTRPSIDSIPRKLLLCLQLQREYKSMWNDKYNARGKFYFPRWESIDHAVPCIYEPVSTMKIS